MSVEAAERRIRYLDGWRGLAILSVLIGHFVTAKWLNLGRFGVELFFVLSGRLMAEILFEKNAPLTSFFPRRISRVYPALFVFCVVIFAASHLGAVETVTWPQFLAAVTFTANYARDFVGSAPAVDHIWSLCVEEHMYVLLGLLALWARRSSLPVMHVCFALALAAMVNGLVRTLMGGDYFEVYWKSDVRGASILLAVALYLAVRRNGPPRFLDFPLASPLLAALGLALSFDVVPDPVKYSLGTACVAFSLVLADRMPARLLAVLEHPLLIRAGLYSYSLYLWQQPFYKAGAHLADRLLLLPLAVLAALVSFYGVEQPARRFLNGLLARRRPSRPLASAA
ncbi:MAG: acyltransferase [Caulobacter sp.]|nr:acyltransferase [Caulobacter sp.]